MTKKAVIIKGNPDLVQNNPRADTFYAELTTFLEDHGYEVLLDAGEPYTTPEPAELWVAHSRGADRLRFAPQETVVVGIGVPESIENSFPIINHPHDEMVRRTFEAGKVVEGEGNGSLDDAYHYVLTPEMKEQLQTSILEKEKRDRVDLSRLRYRLG
ncbi:MAG TPA: hypothetical protein VF696_00930 [Candidatus Paceibacterota bacterium]|jgi:hypothetical protein